MGLNELFGFGKGKLDSKQNEPQEEEEFNLKQQLKGMTEKQLLKLLVLLRWEEDESVAEDNEELIEIAKEE